MIKKINNFFGLQNRSHFLLFLQHNFWAGITTLAKAFLQLSILKITTIFLGSGALGILGQASSCITIFQSLFFGGLLNYLVTTLPRIKGNKTHQEAALGAVALWVLLATIIGGGGCYIFSKDLAQFVFADETYAWFFAYLGAGLFLIAILSVANGILAAYQKIREISYANLVSLFFGVGAFYYSQKFFGLKGGMLGLIGVLFCQALAMLIAALRIHPRRVLLEFRPKIGTAAIRSLAGFSIVMVVTGALGTLYQVIMRSYLTSSLDFTWADVGRWQALLKISEISMSFLGVSLLTSYLPQISSVENLSDARSTVKFFVGKVTMVSGLVCVLLGVLAPIVLKTIYSEEFVALTPLLRLQLVGDFFRLSTWVYTYFFLAKLPLRIFLSFEASSLCLLLVLGLVLSRAYGLQGLVISQVATAMGSFFFGYLIYRHHIRKDGLR